MDTLPFEFADGLIWVKVHASEKDFTFILDSGAGSSVVSIETAKRCGATLGHAEYVMGVGTRAVAYPVKSFACRVTSMPFSGDMLAIDLSNVSRACGRRIDGLIGADFFRHRRVRIDFTTMRISVGDPAPSDPVAASLPIKEMNGAFCVPIAVDGQRALWVRIDTGCNDAMRFVLSGTAHGQTALKSIGFTTRSQRWQVGQLNLGGTRLSGIRIAIHDHEIFPGEAGLLGTGVLSKFKITIDLRDHRLTLEKI